MNNPFKFWHINVHIGLNDFFINSKTMHNIDIAEIKSIGDNSHI